MTNRALNLVPNPQAVALYSLISQGWGAETSSSADWSHDRRDTGQCAITALVVQDILGGELRRALINGESHYWNVTEDGTVIDLTRSQFDNPLAIEDEAPRERDYVLSFPDTAKRYHLLRLRLRELLAGYELAADAA